MATTNTQQLVDFEDIYTLTPSEQIVAVEKLATKENSRLNGALNAYLAQLYKFILDGTYNTDDKTIMHYTSKALAQNLRLKNGPIEELDTFSLNAAKDMVNTANVINTAHTIPDTSLSTATR